jgi:hypothetical protein
MQYFDTLPKIIETDNVGSFKGIYQYYGTSQYYT